MECSDVTQMIDRLSKSVIMRSVIDYSKTIVIADKGPCVLIADALQQHCKY